MGEHLPYKQGVTGSSPVVPTTKKHLLLQVLFFAKFVLVVQNIALPNILVEKQRSLCYNLLGVNYESNQTITRCYFCQKRRRYR